MARLRGHRALDLEQPLYVKRAAGPLRLLKKGELFPWRDLKILPRKVHQLWMQRRIGHERLGDAFQGAEDPHPIIASPAPTVPAASVQPDTSTAGAEEREPAIVPMGAVISPGGEKRTIVIDGKPVELTAGPTINVATPEQQRQRNKRR